jgi:hypothetical protein
MALDISAVPLSLTIISDLPQAAISWSSSRATQTARSLEPALNHHNV